MGQSREERRAHCGARCISLYPADTSLGWRVIRQVSAEQAQRKQARGEWREVHDALGNIWGYQIMATIQGDMDLPSGASAVSITVAECELNAGLRGRSRTAGMSEDQRVSRYSKAGRPLPPEDAIERARAKVRVWGALGSAQGDILRVWPR